MTVTPVSWRRSAWVAGAALALLLAGCGQPPADDPMIRGLQRALRPGDRLLIARALDPDDAGRLAAVVRPATGKPELRIYERRDSNSPYLTVHTSQEGERFHNLILDDVTGDGQEDIVSTWTGGQLEIIEVLTRTPEGAYVALFQNAGQRIERRADLFGAAEFWITSRTFEESSGQPPVYGVGVYRWDGKGFPEVRSR